MKISHADSVRCQSIVVGDCPSPDRHSPFDAPLDTALSLLELNFTFTPQAYVALETTIVSKHRLVQDKS